MAAPAPVAPAVVNDDDDDEVVIVEPDGKGDAPPGADSKVASLGMFAVENMNQITCSYAKKVYTAANDTTGCKSVDDLGEALLDAAKSALNPGPYQFKQFQPNPKINLNLDLSKADGETRLTAFLAFFGKFIATPFDAKTTDPLVDPYMWEQWIKDDSMFEFELDPVTALLLWRVCQLVPSPSCLIRPLFLPHLSFENQDDKVRAQLCLTSIPFLIMYLRRHSFSPENLFTQIGDVLHHIFIARNQVNADSVLERVFYWHCLCDKLRCVIDMSGDNGVGFTNDAADAAPFTRVMLDALDADVKQAYINRWKIFILDDVSEAYRTARWKLAPLGTSCLSIVNLTLATLLTYHHANLRVKIEGNGDKDEFSLQESTLSLFIQSMNTISIRNEVHARLLQDDTDRPSAAYKSWSTATKKIFKAIGQEFQKTDKSAAFRFHLYNFLALKVFVHCEWSEEFDERVALELVGDVNLKELAEQHRKSCEMHVLKLDDANGGRCIALPAHLKVRNTSSFNVPFFVKATKGFVEALSSLPENKSKRKRELVLYYPQMAALGVWMHMPLFKHNVHRGFLQVTALKDVNATDLSRLTIETSTAAPDRMLLIQLKSDIAINEVVDALPLAIASHAVYFSTTDEPKSVAEKVLATQLTVYESSTTSPGKKGLGKTNLGKPGAWATACLSADNNSAAAVVAPAAASVSDAESSLMSDSVSSPHGRHPPRRRRRRAPGWQVIPPAVYSEAFENLERELHEYQRVMKPAWTDFRRLVLMGNDSPKRSRGSVLLSVRRVVHATLKSLASSVANQTGLQVDLDMYRAVVQREKYPRFCDFVMYAVDNDTESDFYGAFQCYKSKLTDGQKTAEDVAVAFAAFLDTLADYENTTTASPEQRLRHYEQLSNRMLFALLQSLTMTMVAVATSSSGVDASETQRELTMAIRVLVTFMLQKPRGRSVQNRQGLPVTEIVLAGKNYRSDLMRAMEDYFRSLLVEITRHYTTSVLRGKFDLTGLPIPLIGTSFLPLDSLLPDLYSLTLRRLDALLSTSDARFLRKDDIAKTRHQAACTYLNSLSLGFTSLLSPIGAIGTASGMSRVQKQINAAGGTTIALPQVFEQFNEKLWLELQAFHTADKPIQDAIEKLDFKVWVQAVDDKKEVEVLTLAAWWYAFTRFECHDRTLLEYVTQIQPPTPQVMSARLNVKKVTRHTLATLRKHARALPPLLFQTDTERKAAEPGAAAAAADGGGGGSNAAAVEESCVLLATAMRRIPIELLQQLNRAASSVWSASKQQRVSPTTPAYLTHSAQSVALLDATHTKSNFQLQAILGAHASVDEFVSGHTFSSGEVRDAPLRDAIDAMITQLAVRLAIRYLIANKVPAPTAPGVLMYMSRELATQMLQLTTYVTPHLRAGKTELALRNFVEMVGMCGHMYDPYAPMSIMHSVPPPTKDHVFAETRAVLLQPLTIAATLFRLHTDPNFSDFKSKIVPQLLGGSSGAAPVDNFDTPADALQASFTEVFRTKKAISAGLKNFGLGAYLYNAQRAKTKSAEALCVAYDARMRVKWTYEDPHVGEFKHKELQDACRLVVRHAAKALRERKSGPSVSQLGWVELASDALIVLTHIHMAEAGERDAGEKPLAYSKRLKSDLETVLKGGADDEEVAFPNANCAYWLNPANVIQFLGTVDPPAAMELSAAKFPPVPASAGGKLPRTLSIQLMGPTGVLQQQLQTIVPNPQAAADAAKSPPTTHVQGYNPPLNAKTTKIIATLNNLHSNQKYRLWFPGMQPDKWHTAVMKNGFGPLGTRQFQMHSYGLPYSSISDSKCNIEDYYKAVSALIDLDQKQEAADVQYPKALAKINIPEDFKPPKPKPDKKQAKADAGDDVPKGKSKGVARGRKVAAPSAPPQNWRERAMQQANANKKALSHSQGFQTYFVILPTQSTPANAEVKYGLAIVHIPSRLGTQHTDYIHELPNKEDRIGKLNKVRIQLCVDDKKDSDTSTILKTAWANFADNDFKTLLQKLTYDGKASYETRLTCLTDTPALWDLPLDAYKFGRKQQYANTKADDLYNAKNGTPCPPLVNGLREDNILEAPVLHPLELVAKKAETKPGVGPGDDENASGKKQTPAPIPIAPKRSFQTPAPKSTHTPVTSEYPKQADNTGKVGETVAQILTQVAGTSL